MLTGAAGQINGTIARKKERLRFPDSPDGRSIAYNFESLDINATERNLNAFYAEFEPSPPRRKSLISTRVLNCFI